MKRTDIHRPSAIKPEDYIFIAFDCIKIEGLGDSYYAQEQRDTIKEHQALTGAKYSDHAHGGNCMVCGNANAIYTALFYHPETNKYVRVGQDCAEKMEMSGGNWSLFRSTVSNHLEAKAGKRKAQAILERDGLTRAWEIYIAPVDVVSRPYVRNGNTFHHIPYEETTIRDIVGKLVTYGSISEAQTKFLGSLLNRIDNREIIEAQRAAEREAAAPCPSGRIVITGVVLKIEDRATDFGVVEKMLVKAKEGYMIWSTVPSKLHANKGTEITFKATVNPSKDDPKFGYASRPVPVRVAA